MAWNCIIRWGTYIALAAGLIFGSASNANADACWDHWRAKLNAINAVGANYAARLKATGDCSYVQKIVDNTNQWNAVLYAIPCQNITRSRGMSENALRAKYMRYCKPSPKTPRQEIAKVPPESPKIPRQKTAKVQPETRPAKPSTQMPAPANEKQGRPLPVEVGARHLRPASAEAIPERSGTASAPSDASALPERPTSPGPSNAQNSCSGRPGTPGCIPGSAPPTPQYFLTDSTPKPTPTPSLGGDVTAMEAIAASAAYFQNLQAYLATEDTLSAGDGAIEAPAPSFEPIDLSAPEPGQYSPRLTDEQQKKLDEQRKKLTEWMAEQAIGKIRDKPFEKNA